VSEPLALAGEPPVRDEFALSPDLLYLNHAAVAPWPRRTAEAVRAFAEENARQGARDYPRWLQDEAQLRELARALLHAPDTGDIALLKNTSEALSVVAYGLDWRAGDNLIITDQEFPSNRIVWESLANQGVEVRHAKLAGDVPEEAIFSLGDARTRLISVSAVQYASGLRLDLAAIGAFCREAGILFCVDAIQQLGALDLDVSAIQADFVMADGHKWLLGPEGLALFYSRPAARERLALRQFGWHMTENPHDFEAKTWQPARDARRFECGSPNMLGMTALRASLSLLLEIGMSRVEKRLLENTAWLLQRLAQSPEIEILSPIQPGRYAGIVTFRHRRHSSAALFQELTRQGVVCAQRGGGIRFSPHFYTPREVLRRAVEML
jgi:selenocysteine lyase/cysteine desulfurase